MHVSLSEQVSQVPSSTAGQPTSQPSVASLLVLNLLAEQAAMVVQVDALEVAADVHATHDVAPATEGHPASHPLSKEVIFVALGRVGASMRWMSTATVFPFASTQHGTTIVSNLTLMPRKARFE